MFLDLYYQFFLCTFLVFCYPYIKKFQVLLSAIVVFLVTPFEPLPTERLNDAECRAIITGTADRRRSKKVSFKLRLAHVPHSPGVKEMLPHPKTKTWTMSEVPSTIIMYDCYKKPTHMGSRKNFPEILKHFPTMSSACLPIHSTNPTIHSPMKEGGKAQL